MMARNICKRSTLLDSGGLWKPAAAGSAMIVIHVSRTTTKQETDTASIPKEKAAAVNQISSATAAAAGAVPAVSGSI